MPFDGTSFFNEQTQRTLAHLKMGRDRIADGWCQRSPENDGKFCTLGAVGAFGFREDGLTVEQASDALIRASGLETDGQLIHWNDDPIRTQKEVLDLYDRAIKALVESTA